MRIYQIFFFVDGHLLGVVEHLPGMLVVEFLSGNLVDEYLPGHLLDEYFCQVSK